jgi:hypothetical protein
MSRQLSWNEIRDRALRFSRSWAEAVHEEGDKQTFWNEFFEVFGLARRSVATFERSVRTARGTYGFLDLFWPGMLLVEHKSRGGSFQRAESQAFAYVADLMREGRHEDVPRYIVICDFARFALHDLEGGEDGGSVIEFPLGGLREHVREFAFVKGEKPVRVDPENPANIKATELLAALHDELEASGYRGHALERMLVRVLFCLFAEDTGIFEPGSFTSLVMRSREDGRDLGPLLAELWDVLNTPEESRQNTLDEDLAVFPYVNGGLYAERLPNCFFNRALRDAMLSCCRFQWAKISPAVFGSLFQSVMDAKARRKIGAHYTSEPDIMKALRSLFIESLREELDAAKADRSTNRASRLRAFQQKVRRLRLFDPACGCGNFLVLGYRELRRLENECIVAMHTKAGQVQGELDVRSLALVDVDQCFGIEIGEWPVRIAEVGLWLQDHQCNVELAEALGRTYRRLPLRATPSIVIGNALRVDWRTVLLPTPDVLVMGNPPFIGKHLLSEEQSSDMALVWGEGGGAGTLDYVTAWYRAAADYIQGEPAIRCAFVSTNSITQGEQPGAMWPELFRLGLKIHFAHRTFAWKSEARGRAHVHVVIIGFGFGEPGERKRIFETARDGTLSVAITTNISPYLVTGGDIALPSRTQPICDVPPVIYGNKPADGGHLLIEPEDYAAFISANPGAKPFVRAMVSAEEFLHGEQRYCLWLADASPTVIRDNRGVRERVEAVREFRLKSTKAPTRKAADRPTLFAEVRQPSRTYIVIPLHSSETRRYIPFGYFDASVIVHNSCTAIPDATIYHFGVLTSGMHMAWTAVVCGRIKSDYRYSNKIVYNNYPWPAPSDRQREEIEQRAQAVLDARSQFPRSTLDELYDPLAMPPALVDAHAALDRAVDRAYRAKAFVSDRERVEHLFSLYEQVIAPLAPAPESLRPGRRRRDPS